VPAEESSTQQLLPAKAALQTVADSGFPPYRDDAPRGSGWWFSRTPHG
jgi:hypothetical protein